MRRANRVVRVAWVCLALLATGCIPVFIGLADSDAWSRLNGLTTSIQASLDLMDQDVGATAGQIKLTGLDSTQTRWMLTELCGRYPYAVDCATVSPQGLLVAVEPADYHAFEGADISGQAQVIALQQSRAPVLSNEFMSVEGFPAVDLEWPMLDGGGSLLGAVSLMAKPAELLGSTIAPQLVGTAYTCMILQTDGTILYDADSTQIGKNTFTDPLFTPYTELLALARRVVAAPSGSGSYTFPSGGSAAPVVKQAWWSTVGLHGTAWRVVLIRAAN